MPGYDQKRFVGISENNLQEYICGICLEVFIKPTITECCGQTYCYDCINEWVSQNSSCPYDRKPITQDQLKSAPKIVTNLLGNMKIKCDYEEEGCTSVIKVNDLDRHKEILCLFNPSRNCKKCGLNKLNGHTDKMCIDQINGEIKESKLKFEKLQNDYDNMIKEKNKIQMTSDLFIAELLEKIQILENKVKDVKQRKEVVKVIPSHSKSCKPTNSISGSLFNCDKEEKKFIVSSLVDNFPKFDYINDQFGLVWVKCSNGNIPVNFSVIGGKNVKGETLYIGRANHNGNLIPGQINQLDGFCFIPKETRYKDCMNNYYNGRYRDYEVLTNPKNIKLDWISYSGGWNSKNPFPKEAIEGGHEAGKFKLFIGRTIYFDSHAVGKICDTINKPLYIFDDSDETRVFYNYEILVVKK